MSYVIIKQEILSNAADDIADYQYNGAGGMLTSHQDLNNDKNYVVVTNEKNLTIPEREVLKVLLEKAKRIVKSDRIDVYDDLTLHGESIQPVIAGIFSAVEKTIGGEIVTNEFWTN